MYGILRWITPLAVIALVAAHYLWPPAFFAVWVLNLILVPANLAVWIVRRMTSRRERKPA